MALSALESITTKLRASYPLAKIALHHRIGVVGISEVSLAVLVSGTHRAEPMAAVQDAVNAVKASVPIWKKEVYGDGSVWKGNVECRWNCGSCPQGALSMVTSESAPSSSDPETAESI